MLREGVLIRSLSAHRATQSHVRVRVGTRQQNRRCANALRRVVETVSMSVGPEALTLGADGPATPTGRYWAASEAE
jgi:hypothetical protein